MFYSVFAAGRIIRVGNVAEIDHQCVIPEPANTGRSQTVEEVRNSFITELKSCRLQLGAVRIPSRLETPVLSETSAQTSRGPLITSQVQLGCEEADGSCSRVALAG